MTYQVFQGDGTRSFIVSRNVLNVFLYDDDRNEAVPDLTPAGLRHGPYGHGRVVTD